MSLLRMRNMKKYMHYGRAGVPSEPKVNIRERSPNMIILNVEPPTNTGGKEVIGYRVEYGRKMMDFAVG